MIGNQRTAGDGMECKSATESKVDARVPALQKKRFKTALQKVSSPIRLIEIVVKTPVIVKQKKEHRYSKDPKFVPYEPYVGAVRPILPQENQKDSKKSKNRMDINTLISQMSLMDTRPSEFKPRTISISQTERAKVQGWNKEKSDMMKRIESLTTENVMLKDQVKQQVQINKELKTMLVASMGEDLETQVQSLNDDKRHLANALLSSAQHLSTHQEQTEWLAGQCEVWRSKFLASSLMIEELAHWKRALSQRTEDLQLVIKKMLEERCRVREMNLYTYKNLSCMHKSWLENIVISEYPDERSFHMPIGNVNLNSSVPHTANIIDLSSVNLKISENISSSYEKCDISNILKLTTDTDAEKYAEQIMSKIIDVKRVNDTPVNALVSHAHSRCSTTPPPIATCLHCNAQVQLL